MKRRTKNRFDSGLTEDEEYNLLRNAALAYFRLVDVLKAIDEVSRVAAFGEVATEARQVIRRLVGLNLSQNTFSGEHMRALAIISNPIDNP